MANQSRFVVRNDSSQPVMLNIEPEGFYFPLGRGKEVSVTDLFTTFPVTVELTDSDQGDRVVSVWPGDGAVRVEYEGVDVFDLVAEPEDPRGPA